MARPRQGCILRPFCIIGLTLLSICIALVAWGAYHSLARPPHSPAKRVAWQGKDDPNPRRPWHYKPFAARGRQRTSEAAILAAPGWFAVRSIEGGAKGSRWQTQPLVITSEPALRHAITSTPMLQRYFFFWISPWVDWRQSQDAFLQSLFAHHPCASVFCLYTTPWEGSFQSHPLQRYASAGYSIQLFFFSPQAEYAPSWSTNEDTRAWITQPRTTFSSHLTDYLRFYLLHEFGGAYVDTDAVFTRSVPSVPSFIGLDVLEDKLSQTPPWLAYPQRKLYLAPGMMRAVKGAPFLKAALEFGFDQEDYDPMCYNCAGPYALNCVFFEPDAQQVSLYSSEVFYPFGYMSASRLFDAAEPFAPMLFESLRRTSVALHLFGRTTSGLTAGEGSVMEMAQRAFSFFPAAPAQDCTLGGQLGALTLVVLGEATAFRDANLLFFSDCALFQAQSPVAVRIEVKAGHLASSAQAQGTGSTALSQSVSSLGEANRFLASLTYSVRPGFAAYDTATVTLAAEDEAIAPAVFRVQLLIFNRLVTVISHTHGRLALMQEMYTTVQQWYPGTPVVVTDDSKESALGAWEEAHLAVVGIPVDGGLSQARNTLIRRAATEFVFLIDDDFSVLQSSHLDALLKRLLQHSFDVAALTIPADEKLYGMSFRGLIEAKDGTMQLKPGNKGAVDGCLHVEFTPNVFLARREALLRVGWDADLKLGEHEEFFYRAKVAGLKILSCTHAHVQHNQQLWWKDDPGSSIDAEYVKSRRRVYDFVRMALKKHGLQRLVSFGNEVVSL